ILINFPVQDAFPVTFLEAAACQRPVISCNLPSYQQTFAARCFQMVTPENPDALAEAIVALINTPTEKRATSIREARDIVEREYDESITIQKLLDVYRSIA